MNYVDLLDESDELLHHRHARGAGGRRRGVHCLPWFDQPCELPWLRSSLRPSHTGLPPPGLLPPPLPLPPSHPPSSPSLASYSPTPSLSSHTSRYQLVYARGDYMGSQVGWSVSGLCRRSSDCSLRGWHTARPAEQAQRL